MLHTTSCLFNLLDSGAHRNGAKPSKEHDPHLKELTIYDANTVQTAEDKQRYTDYVCLPPAKRELHTEMK